MSIPASTAPPRVSPPRKKPFYRCLSFQVVLGVAVAIVLGFDSPATAVAINPLGFALSLAGQRGKLLADLLDTLTRIVFGVVAILMRFAPIGAFGAMAFTIGKYGLASLGPLVKLIATLYITSILFVVILLGGIAR